MIARAPALALAGLLALAGAARAEQLVLSISDDQIPINSNFTGADLALFGLIERDGRTTARASDYDVVVTVRGPRGTVLVREKKPVGPFWIVRDQRRYIAVPALIEVISNRDLAAIAPEEMRRKMRIGVDPLIVPQGIRGAMVDLEEPQFRQALMRIRAEQGLFREQKTSVKMLTPNLFQATIRIPGIAPLGRYDVEAAVFSDGVQLAKGATAFTVVKGGVEQKLARLARERPFLYGAMTAALSLLLGWLASVIFRRD